MKKSLILLGCLSILYTNAQYNGKIGINTDQPKATLDINIAEINKNQNTNEGILIPRLTKSRLAQIDDDYLLEGTLVYVKEVDTPATANTKVENVLANGFHYYDGTTWQPIQKSSPKFDYILSLDGSVLTMWFNKYVDTIDMTQYADMANVTIIAQGLLENSQVKKFVLKDDITTIGISAFANNPNMEIPVLPTSITTIGSSAFRYNEKIIQVHLPNLTTIGSGAFFGNTALTSVSLPQVTTIKRITFYENPALTSVSIPQVTTIEEMAFQKNTALTSINLPKVITIGYGVFQNNTALTSVKLSSNIKTIESAAFRNIAPNAVITIESSTPPTLGNNVFDSTTTIKVPSASVQAYKTAWTEYASQIVGY